MLVGQLEINALLIGWSTWSPWKECSKECGNGERKKVRHCTSPRPLYDGRLCYGMSEYAEGCNYGLCPGMFEFF